MTGAATLGWFARHELRLAWRDWLAMLQAGRPGRRAAIAVGLLLFFGLLHLVGYAVLRPLAAGWHGDRPDLLVLTGSAFLAWALMLSQALESVTRAFYARSDLDLILSSPASAEPIFALRIGTTALAITAMALLLFGPFINMMALLAGGRFLAAYGVLLAMGLSAAAIATWLMVGLFRLFGPRRTRLVAQIVAAIVGAAFAIGVQAVAIVAYGNMSRTAVFHSQSLLEMAPDNASPLWWPARAATGEGRLLVLVVTAAILLLLVTIRLQAPRFGPRALAVAGAGERQGASVAPQTLRAMTPRQALRRKEWKLLLRDPWLLSQSLMQLLYLLPPALLLWRNFGAGLGQLAVLVPVLVMTAGQLAGGLAWLAISGEDARDLITSAPIGPRAALAAKVEAVMLAVAVPLLPFVLALAVAAPELALVTCLFGALAAGCAVLVQIAFRAQARRSQFRRRQTSSRFATFAEAFASISMAAASAFAAAGSLWWLPPFAIALAIVLLSLRLQSGQGG